ncbi:MAG: non-hydrolyzing UDP-N-acetylglucosamine 2-epimerase [bacterium JZ-2024 1]
MLTLLVSFGTRPELIKLAPIIKKLESAEDWRVAVVASGQHKDLAEKVIKFFDIKVHHNCGCSKMDLLRNHYCIDRGLRQIIRVEKPDLVLVQGDTLTTFASSLSAFLEKVPVVHLEAGLRSGDKLSPFPEEVFRVLTDDISDVYLAPTARAYTHLLKEGKREDRIFLTGNTVVDALNMVIERMDRDTEYASLGDTLRLEASVLKTRPKVLITSHRRESIGTPLRNICRAVSRLAVRHPEAIFLWSLHKNPNVRKIILQELTHAPENLLLMEALSYTETLLMLMDSEVILTDSGGIQEEAPTFGKPILILRETTERPETVEYGFGILVGRDEENIVESFERVYGNRSLLERLKTIPNPYGDGRASDRFLKLLRCQRFLRFVRRFPESRTEALYECKKMVGEFVLEPALSQSSHGSGQ